MLAIKHKFLVQFFVLVSFFLLLPSFASADSVIYSQQVGTARTTNPRAVFNDAYVYQWLGTGLTGVLNSVTTKIYSASPVTTTMTFEFWECTSGTDVEGNGTCSIKEGGNFLASVAISAGTSTVQYNFSNGYSLDPTKYYAWGTAVADDVRLVGSTANTWSGGACEPVTGQGPFNCDPLSDLYFLLVGTQTVTDSSYTSNFKPNTGSTTAQTTVHFQFDYHAVTGDNITSYLMAIFDNTANTNFTLNGSASSGDHSVARNVTLSSGHKYTWSVSVCSVDTCFGGSPSTFWVVSTSSVPVGNGTVGNTPTTTTSVGTNSDNVNSFDLGGVLPSGINDLLRTKFPFSYLYDGTVLLNELASGSSQGNASYTFPLGAVSTINGATSSEFTVIDQTAITATGYVTGIRTAISMVIYFVTGFYLISAIMVAI